MCILITKPRGAQFPPLDAVRTSCTNNPDGFALAYNHGGRVITYKTMDAAQFLRHYKRLRETLNPTACGMIIHARIATHGDVCANNCHCWKSFKDTRDELAFAHNGILSLTPRDGMTDSETFLRDFFEPSYRIGGWWLASDIIRRKIGPSKFAFVDARGGIRHFGHFIVKGGCHYSNTSYMPRNTYAADPRLWGA